MTFYFYDTETTGTRPSEARIMQFAGQRTTMDLEFDGEPDDLLIKLTPDVLPEPDAVLVHGITPQRTLDDGLTEAEFARHFQDKIATPNTIFVGFNSVRFDDEFVRYLMYRNFYEPYEWQWKEGRSRWDLLDVLRMMRALRPEGIEWPFDDAGNPTVRLELMTKTNGINHDGAHTALADVHATIAVARKMRSAQPKLFEYLLNMRGKKDVQKIVESGEPFVYTSGKYPGEYLKTTLATLLLKHPRRDAAIVYDLRADPSPLFKLTVEELTARWRAKPGDGLERLPVKNILYNRCPAVAPRSVLLANDAASRIKIDLDAAEKHRRLLQGHPEFTDTIAKALGVLEDKQAAFELNSGDVDAQLYASFWNDHERQILAQVRQHAPATLQELLGKLNNKRMQKMLPLYKARNYPQYLTPEEHDAWEVYRQEKLFMNGENGAYGRFLQRLMQLKQQRTSKHDQFLLTDLQLYAESILPATD